MGNPLSVESLRSIALFSNMDDAALNAIAERCDWQRVERSADVIGQNQESTDIYFVLEGRVAAKGYSHEGKEVTYAEIGSGEVFGEFSAIDGAPRSASIEAMETSTLLRMSNSDFRSLLLEHAELGLALCELLVSKNRKLTNRMFEFSTMAVSQRVCAELLRMLIQHQETAGNNIIKPAPSHYELATRLSTHREAVSKELGRLAKLNIIRSARKSIEVIDPNRLRGMTSFDFLDR